MTDYSRWRGKQSRRHTVRDRELQSGTDGEIYTEESEGYQSKESISTELQRIGNVEGYVPDLFKSSAVKPRES